MGRYRSSNSDFVPWRPYSRFFAIVAFGVNCTAPRRVPGLIENLRANSVAGLELVLDTDHVLVATPLVVDKRVAAAAIDDIGEIRLSANWMAAAGHPGEDARLFDTVN